jgi:hypothetical protein
MQLTDIHESTNAKAHFHKYGDREGDLKLFAGALLPRLRPAAVLVTGDLTDSKDRQGAGVQQEAEWKAWRRGLEALVAGGVPERRILEVRGNHDAFNLAGPRGGRGDHFSAYTAAGRRGEGSRHVFVHNLFPLGPEEAAGGGEGGGGEGAAARRLAAGAEAGCPAAVLLGIDASLDPGLKNPFNFFGAVSQEVVRAAAARGRAARAAPPAACPAAPPLIAYCHYPLSTVDVPGKGAAWGPLGAAHHAARSVRSMGHGLGAALAQVNASAYLSGHLHTVFGERLHRMHPVADGSWMAELESGAWKDDRRFRVLAVDGGAVSFADLHFHSRGAPPRPARADAPARRSAAWLRGYARRRFGVTAADPTAAVVNHVAMLTWPPDARYSPQPAQQEGAHPEGAVRAVVFPLEPGAAAEAGIDVQLSAYLPDGTRLLHAGMQAEGAAAAAAGAAGPRLFAAFPRVTVFCAAADGSERAAACVAPAAFVEVQVTVRGGGAVGAAPSASPRQPVALACRGVGEGRQQCWLAPHAGAGAAPAPLGSSWVEWITLLVHWPTLAHRLYLAAWAAHLGLMLLLPRRLHAASPALVRRILSSPTLRPAQLSAPPPGPPSPTTRAAATARWLRPGAAGAAGRAAASYALWPFAALVLCAGVTQAWAPMVRSRRRHPWPRRRRRAFFVRRRAPPAHPPPSCSAAPLQVAYSLYCLLGPSLAARLQDGSPLALVFHYGVAGRFQGGGAARGGRWRVVPTADPLLPAMAHLAFCVAPLTLWVACVVAGRALRGAEGGGEARRQLMTAPQAAALAAIFAFNYLAFYGKTWAFCGAWALAASPGLAWGAPLAVALVAAVRVPPGRAAGEAAKGE